MEAAPDIAPFLAHGGRVGLARAAFGGDDWIDLSTGVAPWAWPVGDLPLGLERLPGPEEIAALEAAAAAALGVGDGVQVVATPGTDLALRLLAQVVPAECPAVMRPGYAGHAAAWTEARGVTPDQIDGLSGHDLLVLASPANPDGRVADPALLRQLSARMTVVVDEAYADPAPGLCDAASDALIVLRSFGKFYGLPGVRLGIVLAGPRIAAGLRRLLGDWPVSGVAVAVGTRAYRDDPWRSAQQSRIRQAGMDIDRLLADTGWPIVGHAPLFRLIACKDGLQLFRHLARNAILARPFADQPQRLRIALPADRVALARLDHALRSFPS